MKRILYASALLVLTLPLLPTRVAAEGEDNPTGVAGIYNGNVTSGCSYDPYTGNAMRVVEDLVVPGSIGKYPLKWTRTWNSRGADGGGGGGWLNNYSYGLDEAALIARFPDGRVISWWDGDPAVEESIGGWNGKTAIVLADGASAAFDNLPTVSGHSYFRLTSFVDPYGQITTLTYEQTGIDSEGHPLMRRHRITEPGGRYLEFTYDGPTNAANITVVQAFDGVGHVTGSVSYTYSAVGGHGDIGLTRADYSDGTFATYTYEMDGAPTPWPRLVTCDDVRYAGPMRQIKYDYGTNARRIKSEKNFVTGDVLSTRTVTDPHQMSETRGDAKTRTFKYGGGTYNYQAGKLLWFTDFEGHTTWIDYGLSGNGFITSVTDANGASDGDPAHSTIYTRGNPYATPSQDIAAIYKITHPDGSFITQAFTNENRAYLASRTDELNHTTIYTRDPANMRITRKDYPDGGYETFTYNSFGEVLDHRMTSSGIEHFAYDVRGLKTSHTDPYNNVTTYTYYPYGHVWCDRLQKVTYPPNAPISGSGVIQGINPPPPQASETYEYDKAFVSGVDTGAAIKGRGLVTKITHADNNYQTFTHDIYGNLLTSTDELGHTTTNTYDAYKRVLTTTDPLSHTVTNSYVPPGYSSSNLTTSSLPFTVTLPSAKKVNTYYDGNWRKTRVQQAPGTADEANSYLTYDPVGNLLTAKDPRNNITTNVYDNRDRLTSVSDPLNHATTFAHNAINKTSETHANGELITFDTYDPMNRLTQKTVHRDATTTDVTTMQYDCAGNLTTNFDERGNPYSYTPDLMNRPIKMTYPNGLHEDSTYNAAGNVATYTNRSGKIQTFTYDNRNRATGFSWNDSGVTPSQTMTYDAGSRVTQVANSIATINHVFLNDNRLSTEEEWTSANNDNVHRTTTYTYDVDGNRATIQYPSGTAFNYTYSNRNQATSIKPGLSGGTAIVSYVYDASGNITTRTLDNGTSTAFTVDTVNRDTAILHNDVGGTKRFDYAYNTVNDITAVRRDSSLGDGYIYDLTQQTTEYRQNGTVDLVAGTVSSPTADNTLTFDGCGNRTNLNGTAMAFNNVNQPDPITTGIVSDAQGNIHTYNGWIYMYDAQNRLVNITNGTTTAIFYYDGKNRQIARSMNVTFTFSVWDDWELIEEYGTGNVRTSSYLQGAHGPIKSLITNIYFYQDELGSTSHIADSTGHLLESYTYNLYGKPNYWDASGNPLTSSNPAYNVRDLFSGERFVPELGLYDLRNRFMSPDLGRFLQPDPIGFKGDGSNLYRYCGNDWANRSDPMGLDYDYPSDAVDQKSRDGLLMLRATMGSSKYERATSTGIDHGKVFLSTDVRIGKERTTAKGAKIQDVDIPPPRTGSGLSPASALHVHTTNDLHDRSNNVVKSGTLSTTNDRRWSDKEGKTMYTGSKDGTITERHVNWKSDSMSERIKHGGLDQRSDGKKWGPVPGQKESSSGGTSFYLGPTGSLPQASNAEPGQNAADGMGLAFLGAGPKPGPAQ